ncbi:Glycosyl transferase group 1 [Bosea sp. LC85]|uniref:glycosyltransferase family 4 protein n=1 Tax=Bosea sp. LC85 TaxID=1502851 RepID=UPI0004E3E08D|nr:glycosyltransferase family 4 protein [Bosea sp. LC85]KFC70981.1 Glycosyl transferase group 1 [Bosea sp. LC85]
MTQHVLCIGGEDHALRIPFLLALRERGFRVSAAATADPTPFARAGIDYHPFHFDRFVAPLADLAARKALAKLITDLRPEIVQSFDTKPSLLVPLAARGIPRLSVVVTINGLAYLYSSRSPKALLLRPVWRALQQLAARWTTATVFQNVDDQAFFERHNLMGPGTGHLIPGSGVDLPRFDRAIADGPSPEALRQELGVGGHETVVTVSRLTRQKGIPTLLEAAAEIHRQRPNVRFLLVGPRDSEGPLAVTQAEIDRHKPYVFSIGPRSDVPSLLGMADVFVLPTEYREGIPRALLEAAAASRPIVTTRMPGCRDIIRDDWNGYLVAPHAPGQLAARILELLQDRESAAVMGARAAMLVRSEFNLEAITERYASLYHKLADGLRQAPLTIASKGGIASSAEMRVSSAAD